MKLVLKVCTKHEIDLDKLVSEYIKQNEPDFYYYKIIYVPEKSSISVQLNNRKRQQKVIELSLDSLYSFYNVCKNSGRNVFESNISFDISTSIEGTMRSVCGED